MWKLLETNVRDLTFKEMSPDEVLYDFDGPRIFTFKEKSELYFACWSDEDSREKRTRYLVVSIQTHDLELLKEGIFSLIQILDQPMLWVVDRDFDNEVVDVKCLSGGISSVPKGFKPEKDATLGSRQEIGRRQIVDLHQTLAKKLKDFQPHKYFALDASARVFHNHWLASYVEAQKNAIPPNFVIEGWMKNAIALDNPANISASTGLPSKISSMRSELGRQNFEETEYLLTVMNLQSSHSITLVRAKNYGESQERVKAKLLN